MFGIEVRDENNTVILSNSDFTIYKIFETEIPAVPSGSGGGVRTDYITVTIPGYSEDTCFVTITPKSYSASPQSGATRFTPVYIDLGGEDIGVLTYVPYRQWTGSNWGNGWLAGTVLCELEVFKIS